MRYIIYGAGAIGGVIGARLYRAGKEVMLIVRGPHLNAIREQGLTLETPDYAETLKIPAASAPAAPNAGKRGGTASGLGPA